MYLFFDEIQKVKGWEEAINSFRVDLDSDICFWFKCILAFWRTYDNFGHQLENIVFIELLRRGYRKL